MSDITSAWSVTAYTVTTKDLKDILNMSNIISFEEGRKCVLH